MADDKYPIFCGRVLAVPAIVEQNGKVITIVQYMNPKDEPTEEECRKAFMGSLIPAIDDGTRERLEERVKKAIIPMRLDPSVIVGADIRTRFGQLNLCEDASESPESVRTYEVEVVKGPSNYSADPFAALAAVSEGPKHSGMRYVTILEE